MDIGLFGRSLYALCVVGLLLFGLWYAARTVGRKRLTTGGSQRLISVVESSFLSQQVTMHVVRVGTRYFVIGGGTGGVNLIAELESDGIDAWIATQRRIADEQTASIGNVLKRFRGG